MPTCQNCCGTTFTNQYGIYDGNHEMPCYVCNGTGIVGNERSGLSSRGRPRSKRKGGSNWLGAVLVMLVVYFVYMSNEISLERAGDTVGEMVATVVYLILQWVVPLLGAVLLVVLWRAGEKTWRGFLRWVFNATLFAIPFAIGVPLALEALPITARPGAHEFVAAVLVTVSTFAVFMMLGVLYQSYGPNARAWQLFYVGPFARRAKATNQLQDFMRDGFGKRLTPQDWKSEVVRDFFYSYAWCRLSGYVSRTPKSGKIEKEARDLVERFARSCGARGTYAGTTPSGSIGEELGLFLGYAYYGRSSSDGWINPFKIDASNAFFERQEQFAASMNTKPNTIAYRRAMKQHFWDKMLETLRNEWSRAKQGT